MTQTYFMSLISLYRFTTLPEIFRNSDISFYSIVLLKKILFYNEFNCIPEIFTFTIIIKINHGLYQVAFYRESYQSDYLSVSNKLVSANNSSIESLQSIFHL